jgi:hypothetical protein
MVLPNSPVQNEIYTYSQIENLHLEDVPFLQFKNENNKTQTIQDNTSAKKGTEFHDTTWKYYRTTEELIPLFDATPETQARIYDFIEFRVEPHTGGESLPFLKPEFVKT